MTAAERETAETVGPFLAEPAFIEQPEGRS
jgi:hypothetical protein